MNKTLKVFTDLDSFYDSRRGILQHLLTPNFEGTDEERKLRADGLWDMHVAENYKNRRMDTFEYSFFDINREKYLAAYKERELSNWLMYYPSALSDKLVRLILDLEGLDDRPISIKGVELFVNIHPYAFDDEMVNEFISYCNTLFKGIVSVKTLNVPIADANAAFYGQFNYVFKYDLLLSEDGKIFMESLKDHPIPDTAFVVPDILVQEVDTFEGTISERIFALGVTLGAVMRLIPVRHDIYDYRG